jgi:arylsulfatase A-like enzyme
VDRRAFLLGSLATVAAGSLPSCGLGSSDEAPQPAGAVRRYGDIELVRRPASSDAPHVLFLCLDDCNDWLGFLNPHPGTKTPNLDELARRSLSFDHAYVTAPICGPSRTSVMFGSQPFRNGMYDHGDASNEHHAALASGSPALVDDFWVHGYDIVGAGKIFHLPLVPRWGEYRLSNRDLPGHARKREGADPTRYDPEWLSPYDGEPIGHGEDFFHNKLDFGPSGRPAEDEPDGQAARWVSDQLEQARSNPLFLAFGIHMPHEPWRVPQEYFDLHPLEEVVLPEIRPDDLEDLGEYALGLIDPVRQYQTLVEHGILARAVQAYQASISFADAKVGVVLDALAASPRADDTVIAVWSDHGYHLGEKMHLQKFTLWERATRVPLLLHVPGRSDHGRRVDPPVSLIDLGPTLAEVCGFEPVTPYEGASLLSVVDDPASADERPPLSTWLEGNHAIRFRTWRYIRYRNGERELYDHRTDPDEFDNLAADPGHADVVRQLDALLSDQL